MSGAVFGITGWKNSGKTTLTERLVAEFTRRGFRVSTVKHAHHDFDIDREGADSYRHRLAGAAEVAIVSGRRWALMHELRGEDEPKLDEILARLAPCDLVLVEGYKREVAPQDRDAKAGRQRQQAAVGGRSATSARSLPIMQSTARRCRFFRSTTSWPSPTSSPAKPACPALAAETALPTLAVLRLIFSRKEWEYRARGWCWERQPTTAGTSSKSMIFAENLNREEYHA